MATNHQKKSRAKRRARKTADATPIQGLAAFLKIVDENGSARPQNPLCINSTPLDILGQCAELAKAQFNTTFHVPSRAGEAPIWLMLFHALQSAHADFTLLDKHARNVVGRES